MKRMSKIISLPSVLHGTGRRLGLVERVCLSADGQDVAGLVLRLYGPMRRKRFVPFGGIALWGEVAVAVRAAEKIPAALRRQEEILGLTVLDTSGERLGWVTDALIDEETGRVLQWEVSQGIVDDFLQGRIHVRDFTMRPNGVVAVTEDAGGEGPPAES